MSDFVPTVTITLEEYKDLKKAQASEEHIFIKRSFKIFEKIKMGMTGDELFEVCKERNILLNDYEHYWWFK